MRNKKIGIIIFCLFFLVSLAMAQDWEIPKNSITPMTGDDTPYPFKASSNSEYCGAFAAWKAFDGQKGWTQWVSERFAGVPNETANIMYQYDEAKTIYSYLIRGRFDSLKTRLPKSWELQGTINSNATVFDSLDSSNWIKLDERNGIDINDEWSSTTSVAEVFYNIQNPGSYNRYRLCVKTVNGSDVVDIIEIQLFQSKIKRPCVSYNAVVPMTASDKPYPYKAISTIHLSDCEGWRAFDYKVDRENHDLPWMFETHSMIGSIEGYGNLLVYKLPESMIITSYKIIVYDLGTTVDYIYSLEGSNYIYSCNDIEDGIYIDDNWDTLHVREDIPDGTWDNWTYDSDTNMYSRTFDIPNPGAYQYYLLKIVIDNPSMYVWEIDEIQLLVTEEYK